MFSDTYTGMSCLPLCTAIVRPTKSGVIVERRDQVLIGFLSLTARAASTFLLRWSSTNGPFLIERAIYIPLSLGRVAAADDHRIGPLVAARLVTLRRRAPWRHRVVPSAAAVGAATHRMVDRIHCDGAHRRPDAAPAHGACLADRTQAVLFVADFADRRAAIDVHLANFAGAKAHLRIHAFARQQLHAGAGRTRHLRALARLHLDAVDRRADRNVAQRQRVARLDRRLGARQQLRSLGDATRRDDVAALAVGIQQQRDVGAAVGIVFEPLDLRRDAVLVALEIDDPVMLLVAATLVAHRDVAVVVASRAALLAFDERRHRRALVQARVDDLDERPAAVRRGLYFDEWHVRAPWRS